MSPTPPQITLTTAENVMIALIHGVFIILGTIPNGVVFVTLLNDKRLLKEPKNLIISARAFIDGLQSAVICPMPFFAAISGHWTTGYSGCVVYAFAVSWFGLSSIQLNALMAYERYYALSKIPLATLPEKRTYLYIFLCFLAGFLAACFPLFGWSAYGFEAFGYHCSVEWYGVDGAHVSYSIFLLFFFYVVPVTIIVISGVLLYKSIKYLRRLAKEVDGKESLLNKIIFRAQMKATRIVAVMILGFLVAWTPYGILSLYSITHKEVPVLTSSLPSNLAKSALIYNPIIYLFMCRKLRRKSFKTARDFFFNIIGVDHSSSITPSGEGHNEPRQAVMVRQTSKVSGITSSSTSSSGTSPTSSRLQSRRNAWSPSFGVKSLGEATD